MSVDRLNSIPNNTKKTAQTIRTAGDYTTLNSTTWVRVDAGTAMDVVIAASVGEVIELTVGGLWNNQATEGQLDFKTVAGSNSVSNATSSGKGIVGTWVNASVVQAFSASILYTVVSGDISAGLVTFRLFYRTSSATNKTLFATADQPLVIAAINNGA